MGWTYYCLDSKNNLTGELHTCSMKLGVRLTSEPSAGRPPVV